MRSLRSANLTSPSSLVSPEKAHAPLPSGVGVWWHAARPATLSAAIVPVLVGSAAAAGAGSFIAPVALVALVSATLIQVGTNLANDLFDFRKGADTAERKGPLRVTQAGLLTEGQVFAGMVASFAAAGLLGLYLVAVGGWPILAIGLCSIACGVAYTAGRWSLAYLGLGEVFVFLFFGLVAVVATYYLHTGALAPLAFAAAAPVGFLATAILTVNNLRDIETDAKAGKRTLAVRLGVAATRWQYGLCLAGSYLVPVLVWIRGGAGAAALLPLLTLPMAVRTARRVLFGPIDAGLNQALKGTGALHLLFGALWAAGLLW